MSRTRLISVDGANGRAVLAEARRLAREGSEIKGVSQWDASGLFEQLLVASKDDLDPRALLLLYAADLAFRLRWEIEPALAEGQHVVAAPYVDTAVAFGRASGLPLKWLTNLFRFARTPSERHVVKTKPERTRAMDGFVEFGCRQSQSGKDNARALASKTREYLKTRR
jgi:thymidylate kinase